MSGTAGRCGEAGGRAPGRSIKAARSDADAVPVWGKAAIAAGRRRFEAGWHTEIDDRLQMARLRSRLVALAAAVTMVLLIALAVTDPQPGRAASVVLFEEPWLALVVLVTLVRGQRMRDVEFFALLVIGQINAMIGVALGEGRGHVAATALSVVSILIVAALFVESRWLLALEYVTSVTLLVAAAVEAPPAPVTASELGNGAVTLLIVMGAVRLLRDLAVKALDRAKRGEVTDPLTGLANRRGLERHATASWRGLARGHRRVAVLVVDVDHFKRINDDEGHAGGDEILRRLAGILAANLRAEDIAVRLGGEEFLLLCPMNQGQGEALAERIRVQVERELAPVTVSIGVFESLPAEADDLPEAVWCAVDRADRALYVAKHSGRNQVAVAQT